MPNNRPGSPGPKKGGGGPNPKNRANPKNGGKAGQTTKKSAANQRFAERQARKEQAVVEARRARNRRWGLISIGLVLVVIAALVIVKVASSGGGSGSNVASPPRGTPIPTATLTKLASVPLSTLAAAPTNGIINPIKPITGKALTSGNKAELLFIGAEFCPYCAAQRWAMYVALSKFGTFNPNPGQIHSAVREGDVPTLTFYGTTYTSKYLAFKPIEVFTNKPAGNGYTKLETPTKAQSALWQKLGSGSFPFLDFGGKATLTGSQYSYLPMQNLPFHSVANQVGDNSTTIGANIDAGAYLLIKELCHSLSSNQPSNVCSAVRNG